MKIKGIARDISQITNYSECITESGEKKINIGQRFKVLQVSISGFQNENPALFTLLIDDYPLCSYYIYKGTTGEQFKNSPTGYNDLTIQIDGTVENPIYVNLIVEILSEDYGGE